MARYDRQLVLILLAGDARDDALVRAGDDLNAKAAARGLPAAHLLVPAGPQCTGGAWRAALEAALGPLGAASRLYLLGTDDWPQPTVSGWRGEAVADLLAAAGLPVVRTVSIVAGRAGRASGPGEVPAAVDDSFAACLHRRLRTAHGIAVDVLARVDPVEVLGAGAGPDRGRKTTRGEDGAPAAHRPLSKLRFSWEGERQVREWVAYEAARPGGAPP